MEWIPSTSDYCKWSASGTAEISMARMVRIWLSVRFMWHYLQATVMQWDACKEINLCRSAMQWQKIGNNWWSSNETIFRNEGWKNEVANGFWYINPVLWEAIIPYTEADTDNLWMLPLDLLIQLKCDCNSDCHYSLLCGLSLIWLL